MAVAKPPHRIGADSDAALAQPVAAFFQHQVRFCGNQLQEPLRVSIQRGALAASAATHWIAGSWYSLKFRPGGIVC